MVNRLTQERLKELLSYDPLTGVFTRLQQVSNKINHERAGWLDKTSGYRRIGIDGKNHAEHRLVFLYMVGEMPEEVDHDNRIKDDNRWLNLLPSNRIHNNSNRKDNNPFIGVQWHKPSGKWRAVSHRVGNKETSLGSYVTHLAACYARFIYDESLRR